MHPKFLLIFLLFVINVNAQTYKPLIDNYNEWQFTTCFSGCITDSYYTDGDTIVNGKQHKILDGFHYISRTFLIREEVSNKKVFLTKIDPTRIDEYLLYDFSLNEGEEIELFNPISPFPQEAGFFTLDSIRNKPLVDGNLYKHYYLSPSPGNTTSNNNAIWVEGVGSLSLINAPGGEPNFDEAGELSCFFKEGNLFYSNTERVGNCDSTLGLSNINNDLNALKISTLNKICTIYNTKKVSTVSVFDITGKQVLNINSLNKETITLNLSQVNSGIYIIIAKGESNKKVFKVLVK
jgi:hypothetical protein